MAPLLSPRRGLLRWRRLGAVLHLCTCRKMLSEFRRSPQALLTTSVAYRQHPVGCRKGAVDACDSDRSIDRGAVALAAGRRSHPVNRGPLAAYVDSRLSRTAWPLAAA